MTNLTSIASLKRFHLSLSGAPAALALGVALAAAPTWVIAETQVHGTPKAVSVHAENASIEEILVALTNTFNVQFRSSANLDKRLTGTYEGTLQQAVSHILRGYDFFVKSGEKGLEITLLGSAKSFTVIAASTAAKPVQQRADAAAAAAEQPAQAGDAEHPVPVASSGGPTPTIKLAEGPAPVPTAVPAPSGSAAPSPVPSKGSGPAPSPAPPAPGAASTPVPPMPAASAVLPPPPAGGTPSVPPPPGSATSASSPAATPSPTATPPAPSPAH